MKIVIAPNAFKGSLSAKQVADAIEAGIKKSSIQHSAFSIQKVPLADGGDGTLDVFINGAGGKIYKKQITGPLKNKIASSYGILKDGTGIVELARASGLALVPQEKRNPLWTTTYGTGELIREAINKGAKKIIIGVGGSSTCDGGIGALAALGARFKDKKGEEIEPIGANLIKIASIDSRGLIYQTQDIKFIIACDVLNPLLGKDGAARVYGPQKGANPSEVELLEKGLKHFSSFFSHITHHTSHIAEMTGASGGFPYGFKVLLNAELKLGIELCMEMVKFKEKAKDADILITGEGRIDKKTRYGKVIDGVIRFGKGNNIPVLAIVGSIGDIKDLYKRGLTSAISIASGPITEKESMQRASFLIEDTAERVIKILNIKMTNQNSKRNIL